MGERAATGTSRHNRAGTHQSAQQRRHAPAATGRTSRRQQRNAAVRRAYARCSQITGELDFSPEPAVRFRRVASAGERAALALLTGLNALTALVFIGWLLLPAHIPGSGVVGFGGWRLGVARVAFCVVISVETIRLVQNVAVWLFASSMKDPVPKAPPRGLRIAMLTTIVPAKEPLDVLERTLRAMRQVRYRGQVDVWILDEGDDPAVRAMAERLGVHHFSRKGIPKYNQARGPYRARTKAGNHNAWRDNYERYYDVVAQMDPDHVPLPCFLERTIGYFRDPDVAFVVAPQVYGNMYENWVSHGASVQQYLFSGVVERGGNGLDAPLLIGTNHLYRPDAWHEIGGYQDSIIEDHLTSMRVQGTINPVTGQPWRGVYTPDVLAIGDGPESWTDYFNQQKRWAYGIWEILLKRKLRAGIRLRPRQRLLYGFVQFYYPSVGATVLLGTAGHVRLPAARHHGGQGQLRRSGSPCGRPAWRAGCCSGSGCAGSTWPRTSGGRSASSACCWRLFAGPVYVAAGDLGPAAPAADLRGHREGQPAQSRFPAHVPAARDLGRDRGRPAARQLPLPSRLHGDAAVGRPRRRHRRRAVADRAGRPAPPREAVQARRRGDPRRRPGSPGRSTGGIPVPSLVTWPGRAPDGSPSCRRRDAPPDGSGPRTDRPARTPAR